MAGTSYTRQSTFIDGDTITAALFNDEYNQLVNAFSYASSGTTGHQHDGTAGEGGNIHTIGDQDFLNKIVVDSTNNRWGVYVEVSGAAVEQIRIQDGAIVPVTDNDIDLGTSLLEFKDLYLDGTANIDSLIADTVDINAGTIDGTTIGATSASTGAFTTLAASGATTLSGTLSVEGNTTLGNAATDTVTFTADVSSNILPSADSTYDLGDGSTYWANAYIDAVTTTGNVAIGGNLTVTGNATIAGNLTFGDAATDTVAFSADVASNLLPSADGTYSLGAVGSEWQDLYIDGTANIDSLVADTADINGGTIDSTAIGSTTASTGNFSTLSIGGTAITATAAELNVLDGITSTVAELNILDGVTSTASELNLVDGSSAGTIVNSKAVVYGATGEVNATTLQVGGVAITSTPAELNVLDGITATVTELNYTDGVTSNIQTQLDTKAPLASPTFTGTVTADGLSLGDNEKATFGAGNDLEIYHDGSQSIIADVGTGPLVIKGGNNGTISLQNGNGETMLSATGNGSADLYYDNALKLATTSTGIDVTGNLTLESTDAGAGEGPEIFLHRNSASPAASDVLGVINFDGENSAGSQHTYGKIKGVIVDPTNTSEDGKLVFQARGAGAAFSDIMTVASTGIDVAGTTIGSGDVGFGVTSLETTSSTRTALTLDNSFFAWGRDSYGEAGVAQGSYRNSAGNDEYRTTGVAVSQVAFSAGTINLQVAASGTNGNTISWTDGLVVDNSGNVGIGTSSVSGVGSYKVLQIRGSSTSNGGLIRLETSDGTSGVARFYAGSGSTVLESNSNTPLTFGTNATERMRIDSSGNLLVGTTTTNTQTSSGGTNTGTWINSDGIINIGANSNPTAFFNRQSTDGDIVTFRKDGSTVGSILNDSTAAYFNSTADGGLARAGTVYFKWSSAQFYPNVDDSYDLGIASRRFDDIYATNATIQTSDRNEKQDIESLSEAEQRVAIAAKGLLRKFRWKSAVEEKGDDARIHFGIIAQDLQAAFEAEGLDAGRYAMFIHSTWTDEETGEERSRMGVRYSELLAFIIAAI